MTNAILCSPHHEEGKAVYGERIVVEMEITGTDGRTERLGGEFDLCPFHIRKQLGDIVDRLRALNAPPVIPGRAEPPSVPPAEPPRAIRPATASEPSPPPPEPPAAPAAPRPVFIQKPGIFQCLEEDCGEEIQYRTRGHHSSRAHDKKAWEVSWLPLFDASGWHECTCGYIIGTESGMKQHPKAAGAGHFPKAEPYHWGPEDMQTPIGAAFARAIGQ